ncbi:MAG: permease prefix domain 2-containing transporter [Bacteroidota bacterium]
MKKKENKPSRIALAFFHWYCKRASREEIEGDLMERFSRYKEKYGYTKANQLFIKEVILLFRPTLIGNIYQLTNTETMMITNQNKRLLSIMAAATALLFIPFVAMQFTSEVNWQFFDFLVAAILLCGTGLVLEFILRKVKTRRRRMVLALTLFLVLILVWAELAVGIFGTVVAGS